MYEIALQGSAGVRLDERRFQPAEKTLAIREVELALLRVRYKQPGGDCSELIERPVRQSRVHAGLQQTPARYRFAAMVAAFGQLLRGGRYTGDFEYADVLALARNARCAEPFG